MECDDSATDDDATEDEEEKTAVDVTSDSLVNEGIETKWYGLVIILVYTVPCKCKLTVSTRNSILDPRSYRGSRLEFRVSSFETLEEFFEDLDGRFRGND